MSNHTEYLQFVTLLVTIISSYLFLSRQIKKTKQSDWIEKLRTETATFVALTMSTSHQTTIPELKEILKTGYSILMLLNPDKQKHSELQSHISELTILLSQPLQKDHITRFKDKHEAIIRLAREIIQEETKKI